MTPAPISVERLAVSHVKPYGLMYPDPRGEFVRHSDYAALLHQLADAAATESALDAALDRATKAERAREGATGLLREVLVWRRTVPPIAETPRKDGGIFGRIAAFLAASGGA